MGSRAGSNRIKRAECIGSRDGVLGSRGGGVKVVGWWRSRG